MEWFAGKGTGAFQSIGNLSTSAPRADELILTEHDIKGHDAHASPMSALSINRRTYCVGWGNRL